MRFFTITLSILLLVCVMAANAQAPSAPDSTKQGTLYVVAASHLDTQWRWTIQNTINEYVPSTFRDNFKLFEKYPGYNFGWEGAFHYSILKEYYPEEYARLKPYIASGRWRVTGSWWDAVDVNMPSFESLVRQTLYGNGFFKREFGKESHDIFLPDCFGFGYALPSIAVHCGLRSFSTQKLAWGSAYGIPFDIGIWEGVDGSTIYAALNPGSYSSQIRTDLSKDSAWVATVNKQGETSGLYAGYKFFGTGDIGGSPDSASVGWLSKSAASAGPLEVVSAISDDLPAMIAAGGDTHLPRYKGELVMTRHGIGCYTSEAAMKRWNRKNELLADAAERASVIAALQGGFTYPREEIRDNWQRFLWHQFHDDLTGTSIPEAYEFSWNDEILCQNRFSSVIRNAIEATTPVLDTRAKGTPIVAFNPIAINREDVVETFLPAGNSTDQYRVYGPDGNEVPSQTWTDELGLIARVQFVANAPSVGYAAYDMVRSKDKGKYDTGLEITSRSLENKRYKVKLNDNGDVTSIYDKAAKRELLATPITFQLLHDKPDRWPAWEIQYEDITSQPEILTDKDAVIRMKEYGPVRVAIEVTRHAGNSTFRQVISLAAGSSGDRVEFHNYVDWYEKEKLLKAAFTFTTPNDSVTYDLGLGTIKRGLNREKLYEVPAHQWADMTDADGTYGVTVMNDCKYGWDHPDPATLRLSLIHTPGVYENWSWVGDQSTQDMGHHEFTFAVAGHTGDWRDGASPWQAARLNQPMVTVHPPAHNGELGKTYSLLNVNADPLSTGTATPDVFINAIKYAEDSDEIIVRLRELSGHGTDRATVKFALPIVSAREVNGMEEDMGKIDISDGVLTTSLKPYQPRAFAVKLAEAKKPLVTAPVSHPLTLSYNLDGVSTDTDRKDGDFDGQGNTLSGDLMPDTLTYENVKFVFGSKTDGATNVVTCNGQKIDLPAGCSQLYLLASAVGGPAEGTFKIGDKEYDSWVNDYAEPVGQWNNRLVAGGLVSTAAEVAPGYINTQPVAWVGTHRHTADGENEAYRFTYAFSLQYDIPEGAKTLTLPDNDRIRLLAATAVRTDYDDVKGARNFSDNIFTKLAKVNAERHDFLDSIQVRLTTPNPRVALRYTVDNTDPTWTSPAYAGPVTLTNTGTVRAAVFSDKYDKPHVTAVTFTKVTPIDAVTLTGPSKGLNCAYYEGEWKKLPDFDSLKAVKTEVVDSIAIPDFARPEDYGFVMTGYVNVPREGIYDFYMESDDGSALWVADTLVINSSQMSGSVPLKAGLHPIKLYMFQAKGYEWLTLTMAGPGMKPQAIPRDLLFHDSKPAWR